MTGSRRLAAALLLAAACAPAACSDDQGDAGEARPVGQALVGSVAPLAQCRDWNGGTREERIATIHDIREQVNLKDSNVQTPELSDAAAYRILDNICSEDYASTFRLYKLYARAASFAPFAED
jgi:hypothetical protein